MIVSMCVCMIVCTCVCMIVCMCVCMCRYYLPYSENNSNSGINFLLGIVNAIVFVALILVMTVILVLLFKYRCDKVRLA